MAKQGLPTTEEKKQKADGDLSDCGLAASVVAVVLKKRPIMRTRLLWW